MQENNPVDPVKEERAYFLKVIKTFKSYRELSIKRIESKEKCLGTLPNAHKKWLSQYHEDLQKLKQCVEKNAEFIPIILNHAYTMFDNVYPNTDQEEDVGVLSEGIDKVQSVFKQLMRDWSSLGSAEREQCYNPIIDEIELHYPEDQFERENIQILVPGAGLGRLAFEIALRGFQCQGNEFNLFMLMVSFYVLNLCKNVDEYLIYPWVHQYCNNISVENQMVSARFPDIKPSSPKAHFSMTAGDFLEVYTNRNAWDCVATCFFIDCAPNVVQFIETIFDILKPGGLWVNLGPLLYHYSEVKSEKSIEPSFEVVSQVIKKIGFEMEKCKTGVKTKYCQNPLSMLQYEYDSVFFVCRKPLDLANGRCDNTEVQL